MTGPYPRGKLLQKLIKGFVVAVVVFLFVCLFVCFLIYSAWCSLLANVRSYCRNSWASVGTISRRIPEVDCMMLVVMPSWFLM